CLGGDALFWYYAPLVPGMVAMIGLGLEAIKRLPLPARAGYRSQSGLAVLILGGVAVFQIISLHPIRENPDSRLVAYHLAGEWLAQNTLPTATIGTLEVGVIGYYAAPRPMVDFAGLIQPEVATLFAPEITYQNTAIWAIGEYTPNFLVLQDGLFPHLEQTWVAAHCVRVKRFPGEETGYSADLIVYKCP
ncbi:MAG: hypothetical protein HC806_05200, partial [Anaerolineae bacterium]|nr:hypothetical protein [Anaerolineae bacterium]